MRHHVGDLIATEVDRSCNEIDHGLARAAVVYPRRVGSHNRLEQSARRVHHRADATVCLRHSTLVLFHVVDKLTKSIGRKSFSSDDNNRGPGGRAANGVLADVVLVRGTPQGTPINPSPGIVSAPSAASLRDFLAAGERRLTKSSDRFRRDCSNWMNRVRSRVRFELAGWIESGASTLACPLLCRLLGRLADDDSRGCRRRASEKRQGAKLRE